MTDSFLAPGNREEVGVQRRIPVPVEAGMAERLVKGPPMRFLRLGQRAVDVEDNRPVHAFTEPAGSTTRRAPGPGPK